MDKCVKIHGYRAWCKGPLKDLSIVISSVNYETATQRNKMQFFKCRLYTCIFIDLKNIFTKCCRGKWIAKEHVQKGTIYLNYLLYINKDIFVLNYRLLTDIQQSSVSGSLCPDCGIFTFFSLPFSSDLFYNQSVLLW